MQIQKINLRCEGNLEIPGLKVADVNEEGQVLAVRKVDGRSYIRMINRLNREMSSEFTSECKYAFAHLITHPTDADFLLESCWICQVIRNYNIQTGHCSIVYKGETHRICHGPTGSVLAFGPKHRNVNPEISIIKWDKEHHQLRIDKSVHLKGRLIQMCYSELFDMLVVVMYEDKEINAVKLVTEAAKLKLSDSIWQLSGVVDDLVIKPTALTSDKKGNIYVGDGVNSRVLKINSLTGEVLSVLLLEEQNLELIRSLFWSDTGPNLIVIRGETIICYCIPRHD